MKATLGMVMLVHPVHGVYVHQRCVACSPTLQWEVQSWFLPFLFFSALRCSKGPCYRQSIHWDLSMERPHLNGLF